MEQSLVTVMKSIGTALQLDGNNNYQAAYIKYLESIISIASILLENVKTEGGKIHVSKEVVRHVQLGQQCMERLATLVNSFVTAQSNAVWSADHVQAQARSQLQTKQRFSEPIPPLHPDHTPYTFSRKHDPTPMEMAYKQNQQLMTAYKARLARMDRGTHATMLSLTVQRKMAENLAIAKAQEEALGKKMAERQMRLEEQAKRRFAAPVGMSEEEQEQRQIYKRILEYEQDAKWQDKFTEWREKLDSSPENPFIISQLIQTILSYTDHPLTELLKTYQDRIYKKLYPIVERKMKEVNEVSVPLSSHLYLVDDQGRSNEQPEEVTEQPKPEELEGDNSSDDCVQGGNTPGENGRDLKHSDVVHEDEHAKESLDDDGNIPSVSLEFSQNSENNNVDCDEKVDSDEGAVKQILEELNVEMKQDDMLEIAEPGAVHLEDVMEQSKENLETALKKGKKVQKQLTIENERATSIIQRISECERYEQDHFDELFDDESDDDNAVADQLGNQTSIPEKSKVISRGPPEVTVNPNASQPPRGISKSVSVNSDQSSLKSLSLGSVKSSQSFDSLSDGNSSKVKEEAYERHMKAVAQDVHNYLEKLLVIFTIAYESLDSPAGRDQCYASLEEPFFKPIWKYILGLFRLSNKTQEIRLAHMMTTDRGCRPQDYGVVDKLCLEGEGAVGEEIPYFSAIQELLKVKEYYTMLSKLECVVRATRKVCSCVEDFYAAGESQAGKKTAPNVGADDLLPILSYVVIRTQMPQLVSECQAMSEFIHEGYIMGEEGYCLTSLLTAINYISSPSAT